jgi:hypothetical protein
MNINPEHQAKEEQIRNLKQELAETEEVVMRYQNVGDNHTADVYNRRCTEIKKSIDTLKMEIEGNDES